MFWSISCDLDTNVRFAWSGYEFILHAKFSWYVVSGAYVGGRYGTRDYCTWSGISNVHLISQKSTAFYSRFGNFPPRC